MRKSLFIVCLALAAGITRVPAQTFPGNALSFDGVDDYITLGGASGDLYNAEFYGRIVEVWIRPNVLTGKQTIFEIGDNSNGMGLRINNGMLEGVIIASGQTNKRTVTAPFPADGYWHHVLLLFQDYPYNKFSLYIDGVAVQSTIAFGIDLWIGANSSPAGIGATLGSDCFNDTGSPATNFYGGKMDEFRVWDNATFTADRYKYVDQLFSSGLVTYYTFDQGTADADNSGITTVTDMFPSPSGHDATMSNFALTGSTSNWTTSFSVDANITAFSFTEQAAPATINTGALTVSVKVNVVAPTFLIPTFSLSTGAVAFVDSVLQESAVSSNDFSSPASYLVVADGGAVKKSWTINVTGISQETDFLTFSIPEQSDPAAIDAANHAIDINVGIGTDVTNLVPEFTLSTGASVAVNSNAQTSGVSSQDFTNPVIYTITAEDGVTTQDWTVTMHFVPLADITSFALPFEACGATINLADTTITLNVISGTDVSGLVAHFELSPGASASVNDVFQISGESVNNFGSPITYTVVSSDGLRTKNWMVSTSFQDPLSNVTLSGKTIASDFQTTFSAPADIMEIAETPVDIDGVNGPDIITNLNTYYLNDGSGNFTLGGTISTLPAGDFKGDFDGDGLTDILSESGGGASWYRNNGDATFSTEKSIAGNALNFDGTDDYVSINTGTDVLQGTFTVEAWAKPMHATDPIMIVSTRRPSEYSFDMKFWQGNKIHGDIGNGSGWVTIVADAAFSYTVGQWYHIAYVVTPTGYTIYVDGNNVGSGTYASTTPKFFDSNHIMYIGRYSTGIEEFLGDIDEVRVWNVARTQSEIQNNRYKHLSGNESGLVAYYTFDQGVAGGDNTLETTLHDKTSNGYDGTLSGFALTGTSSNWVNFFNSGSSNLVVADMDGDNDMDILSSSTEVAWYENMDGAGENWAYHTVINSGADKAYATDVDGDGAMDVIDISGTTVSWSKNNGGGTSWTRNTITGLSASSLIIADMNGDGHDDFIAGTNWYPNNADGTIGTAVNYGSRAATKAFDFDGDGNMDLAVVGNPVSWYRNKDGLGNFSAISDIMSTGCIPPDYFECVSLQSMHFVDLDGNGSDEITYGRYSDFGASYFGEDYASSIGYYKVSVVAAGPTITNVVPASGRSGDPVQIQGTGYDALTVVTVNGKVAPITGFTATTLDISVPEITGPSTEILVTNCDGASAPWTGFTLVSNNKADFLAFHLPGQDSIPVIDNVNNTVDLNLIGGTDPSALVADFSISSGATITVGSTSQTSGTTPNDFSSPITYTIVSEDGGTTKDWMVTAAVIKNTEANIISFMTNGQIDATSIDTPSRSITLTVSDGTDLTNLVANFELSSGASASISGVDQVSGTTANDFSSPVTYTVLAEDGINTLDWIITVLSQQSITSILPDTVVYTPDPVILTSTASSGLGVTYSTSSANASISGDSLMIIESGKILITITQSGNSTYLPVSVVDSIYVLKAGQSITFDPIADKQSDDAPFTLNGSTDSGLGITYSPASSFVININGQTDSIPPNVTINGNEVTITSPGRASIVASQPGDVNYNSAKSVLQTFCILPPKPVITQSGSRLASSSAEGNQWYLDGIKLPGATDSILDVEEQGIYTVQVTINQCVSLISDGVNFTITGIDDTGSGHELVLYPNPAESILNVQLRRRMQESNVSVTILDSQGKYVMTDQKFMVNNNLLQMDVSAYPRGLYTIIVMDLRQSKIVRGLFILE